MSKKAIVTSNAPSAIGPYSQGISAKGFVFASGQLPLKQDGSLACEIKEATELCLKNLQAILESGGSALQNIVKTTVFLTDMADFPAMNETYAAFFGTEAPARSCVQVAALPKGALIEIEAIATLHCAK